MFDEIKQLINETVFENDQQAITASKLNGVLQSMVNATEKEIVAELVDYIELKSLRNAGKLVPGRFYRITDYITTTVQANTKSAGHPFDVIVLALSESELSEQAWAIQSERDTDGYFANSELSAWQIWYCLDNDTMRFGWADVTNGKGVIYRMIDEWNNDVPYDFKNIQFYRKWSSSKSLWSTISSDNTGVPCYTFSSSGNSATTSFTDMSLSASNSIHSNVIGKYVNDNKQTLNNICFFGNNCYSNTFGNSCWGNTFGDHCLRNTFGNNCYSNTFGNSCNSNTFGNNCSSNTFGNNCWNNTFGNNCYSNTFGNNFQENTFGNKCYDNTFGNNCSSNTFGNSCKNIKFASTGSASTKYNYYQNNHFGDGCQYILFKGADTASASAQVQNYNFTQGLQGTSSSYITIEGKRSRAYETYVSKDTDGTIKESVVAEKLDKIVEIAYADLVALRDASKLIPGQQYRITDYECTTMQDGTRSAGHSFDIIVTADDVNVLNEVARAVKHEGDTYFADNDLNAWQIWYSLDNDTTRFAWAMMKGKYVGVIVDEFTMHVRYAETKVINDVTYDLWLTGEPGMYIGTKTLEVGEYCDLIYVEDGNFVVGGENFARISDIKDVEDGKGVIYRMIDEFGNDCPYDFKNIQFYRQWDEAKQLWSTVSYGAGVPCYTFSSEGDSSTTEFTDMSLLVNRLVYSNTIKAYSSMGIQTLNDNCFFGEGCYNNAFGNSCSSNTFGNSCYNNAFGEGCSSNTFGNSCYSNAFGNYCNNNAFGNDCNYNAFGEGCHSNAFGNSCNSNTFGNSCDSNAFGNSCSSNAFGNSCSSNAFGNGCRNNAFGNSCDNNAFGKGCDSNVFGNNCWNNAFGENCQNNAFGNSCSSNAFGNDCDSNAFGHGCISIAFGNNCNWNSFGNACEGITFGNDCNSNSFGNNCGRITFALDSSASTKYNYYRGNHFGDCCRHIVFAGAETASIYSIVSNYNFAPGLGGQYDNYLTIDGVRNRDYETKVAKNSSGEIKQYCEADLIL